MWTNSLHCKETYNDSSVFVCVPGRDSSPWVFCTEMTWTYVGEKRAWWIHVCPLICRNMLCTYVHTNVSAFGQLIPDFTLNAFLTLSKTLTSFPILATAPPRCIFILYVESLLTDNWKEQVKLKPRSVRYCTTSIAVCCCLLHDVIITYCIRDQ